MKRAHSPLAKHQIDNVQQDYPSRQKNLGRNGGAFACWIFRPYYPDDKSGDSRHAKTKYNHGKNKMMTTCFICTKYPHMRYSAQGKECNQDCRDGNIDLLGRDTPRDSIGNLNGGLIIKYI